MLKHQNICIINEHQLRRDCGGVQTVGVILKEKFEQIGYNICVFFTKQEDAIKENEYKLPNILSIDSDANLNFITNKIKEHQISVIICLGYTNDLLCLCTKAKKITNNKLIYAYHRNPKANIKEYDDYCEQIIKKYNTWYSRSIINVILGLKRFTFNYKCKLQSKKEMQSYSIKDIDKFITLNRDYTNYMKSFFPKKYHNKFLSISNPIEITEYNGIHSKKKNILFLARQTYQKRLDRLFYVWEDIYRDFPEWSLTIVGSGEYLQEYKKIAKDLKLENVVFVGQQPAIEYYKNSSIICMTSSHEGQPMTLIESQVFGCIPIAYKSFSSLNDIIVHNYNGLLIKPFKKKEYTQSLKRLMNNEMLRKEFMVNGKEFVKKFDINNIIVRWISILNQL